MANPPLPQRNDPSAIYNVYQIKTVERRSYFLRGTVSPYRLGGWNAFAAPERGKRRGDGCKDEILRLAPQDDKTSVTGGTPSPLPKGGSGEADKEDKTLRIRSE